MNKCSCLGALIVATLILAAAPLAYADAQEALAWKLKKGETFFVETAASRKGTLTVAGKVIEVESVSTVVVRFTVLDKTAEHYIIEEEILLVRDKPSAGPTGFSKAAYKAALEPSVEPGTGKIKKGATFKLRLRPDGRLEFSGYDKAAKQLARANNAALKLINEMTPEDYWKGFVADIFSILPGKPVNVGGAWNRPVKIALGPLGDFSADYRYVFKSKTKGAAEIAVTATMKYSAPARTVDGFLFKITGGKIETTGAAGSVQFDIDGGRLIRSTMTIPLKGKLTLEVGDRKTVLEVDQRQVVSCQLLDRNPLRP